MRRTADRLAGVQGRLAEQATAQQVQLAPEAEVEDGVESCCDQGESGRDVEHHGRVGEGADEGDGSEEQADGLGEARRALVLEFRRCAEARADEAAEDPAVGLVAQARAVTRRRRRRSE